MGNTNGREVGAGGGGQHSQSAVGGHGAVGGQRVGHPGYGVPPPGSHGHPQAQQMRDQGRLGHAPSTESMSQSPSESPGSAARSPLMFTPQVGILPCVDGLLKFGLVGCLEIGLILYIFLKLFFLLLSF